jgi:hypothetical protein
MAATVGFFIGFFFGAAFMWSICFFVSEAKARRHRK